LSQLEKQVEFVEDYMVPHTICSSGATCQGFGGFELPEKTHAEEVEALPDETIRLIQMGLWKNPLWSRADSPLTLEGALEPLEFYVPESPFIALDEKLSNEEKIRRLIDYIRDKSNIQFAPELAARLEFLHEAVMEDPDETPISPESLSNFIGFLQEAPNLRSPDIVLTPSNEIRAQWRTAPNRHFAAAFLPTGETRYVIFTPNLRDPDKIDRLSGTTPMDTLMETAEPHRVLDWASQ
jgi:hypothetical protein